MSEYKIVYSTAGSVEEAAKISEKLIAEKLAACVNFFPIKSIYRWKGKIQKEGEFAMVIKTRGEMVDKVIARVNGLHSYEMPEIVVINIEKGKTDYLRWIDESTS